MFCSRAAASVIVFLHVIITTNGLQTNCNSSTCNGTRNGTAWAIISNDSSQDNDFPNFLHVNNSPPLIHGDSNDIQKSSSDSDIGVIIPSTIGAVVCVCVAALVVWKKLRKKRISELMRNGPNSHSESEVLLSLPSVAASSEIESSFASVAASSEIKPSSDSALCTADITKGGLVVDKLRKFALYVPVQRNIAHATVSVSSLPLNYTAKFPPGVYPLSCPIRLLDTGLPDDFKYERPGLLIMPVDNHLCIPPKASISLWHSTNPKDPNFTRLDDTECYIDSTTSEGHRYVVCWLKGHCDVVPCYQVPYQPWVLFAGVFAETTSLHGDTNLHVLIGNSSETVQNEVDRLSPTFVLTLLPLTGRGTADGMIKLDLEGGFSRLEISITPFQCDMISASVCGCKSGTRFVHHVVFPTHSSSQYDVRVSTLTDGVYKPADPCISTHLHLLYENRLDLAHYLLSPSFVRKHQQPQWETWSLADRVRVLVPPCYRSKAQTLRTDGTTLADSNYSPVVDFIVRIGMSSNELLTLAQRLSVEEHLRQQLDVEGDTSQVATARQVETLVTCYKSVVGNACIEEVLSHFMALQESSCRVDYCQPPSCDDTIFHSFAKLIICILTEENAPSHSASLSIAADSSSVTDVFLPSYHLTATVNHLDEVSRECPMIAPLLRDHLPRGHLLDDHLAMQVSPRERVTDLTLDSRSGPLACQSFVICGRSHQLTETADGLVPVAPQMQADTCHIESQGPISIVDKLRHDYHDTRENNTNKSNTDDMFRREYDDTRDNSKTGPNLRREYGYPPINHRLGATIEEDATVDSQQGYIVSTPADQISSMATPPCLPSDPVLQQ